MTTNDKQITPFDFIKSLSHTKKNLIRDEDNNIIEESEKQYNAFMINRGFSYFEDTILYANEINKFAHLDKIMQHDYYIHSLRERNRFSKWHKPTKDKRVELIQRVYSCSKTVAFQYLDLLTEEKIRELELTQNKGGT